MEPRGSVTLAWDTLGLFFQREVHGTARACRPACRSLEEAEDTDANLFVEGSRLASPTEQTPLQTLRTSVDGDLYLGSGGRTNGTTGLLL